MSKYAKLDTEIMNKMGGHPQSFGKIYSGHVLVECRSIAEVEGTHDAWRVVDRRLQALRKAGKIRFARGSGGGWVRVTSQGAA